MMLETIIEYLEDTYGLTNYPPQWRTDRLPNTYAQFHWSTAKGFCWVDLNQDIIAFDTDDGPDKICYLSDPECFTKFGKIILDYVKNSPNHISILDCIVDKMGSQISP